MDKLSDDVLISVLRYASFEPRDVFCSYPATCHRWNDILTATRPSPNSDSNSDDPVQAKGAAAADTGAGTNCTGNDIDEEATEELWKDLVRLHHPSVMEGLVLHNNASDDNNPNESLSRTRQKTSSGAYKEKDSKLSATTRTTSGDTIVLCWRQILRTLEQNARLRPAFERDERRLDMFRPWLLGLAGGGVPSDGKDDEAAHCSASFTYSPPQLDSYEFLVTIAEERGGGDAALKEEYHFTFAANTQFRTCQYKIGDDSDVATSEMMELDLIDAEDGILVSAVTKMVVEVCKKRGAGQSIDDQGGKATLFQWVNSTPSGPLQELQSCRFYNFAKFRALNHCSRARNPIRDLQSLEGVTCCVPSTRVDVAALLSSQQSGNGKINKIILKMEWADPVLREHLAMQRDDVLTLLDKGMDYNDNCGSPHHVKDSYQVNIDSERIAAAVPSFLNPISPRPIDSYSFLVQYSLVTVDANAAAAVDAPTAANGRRTISTMYNYHPATSASVETDDFSPYGSKLVLDVPRHCHEVLPPDPYRWERTQMGFGTFTSMAVYVIQNDTGLQAKLYEGDAIGIDQDYWGERTTSGIGQSQYFMMGEYDKLPLFAAASYFSIPRRDDQVYIGLPKVSGELYHQSKESVYSKKKSKVGGGKRQRKEEKEEAEDQPPPPSLFKICLNWIWQKKDGQSASGLLSGERELLVFLERGLCFK